MAKAKARQAKSRKARKQAGERQVSVWLDTTSTAELKRLKGLGETKGAAINRLLHESAHKHEVGSKQENLWFDTAGGP